MVGVCFLEEAIVEGVGDDVLRLHYHLQIKRKAGEWKRRRPLLYIVTIPIS
jgi:hypothetical protein